MDRLLNRVIAVSDCVRCQLVFIFSSFYTFSKMWNWNSKVRIKKHRHALVDINIQFRNRADGSPGMKKNQEKGNDLIRNETEVASDQRSPAGLRRSRSSGDLCRPLYTRTHTYMLISLLFEYSQDFVNSSFYFTSTSDDFFSLCISFFGSVLGCTV